MTAAMPLAVANASSAIVGGLVGNQPVMARQLAQGELQDNLAGALRPTRRPLDLGQASFEAAHVDQDAGVIRSNGLQRLLETHLGGHHPFAHFHRVAGRSTAVVLVGGEPVPARRDLRVEVGGMEIGRQPFAGVALLARDEWISGLVAALMQPGERPLVAGRANQPPARTHRAPPRSASCRSRRSASEVRTMVRTDVSII